MHLTPNLTDEQCYRTVEQHILTKTPFCLTRFGDGEIQFLNNTITQNMKEKVCKLWDYDYHEFEQVRKWIYDSLITALSKSDMIGIMGSNEVSEILNNMDKWHIQKSFVDNLRTDQYDVCDHQATRSRFFGDYRVFKQILHGRSVNIISPRMEKLIQNDIETLLETEVSYTLATNDRQALFNSLDSIQSDVVIYGTSLTGKDIGVKLKEMSKIAIDFGATLDAWAGIESRPWFQEGNLQDYCLIRK